MARVNHERTRRLAHPWRRVWGGGIALLGNPNWHLAAFAELCLINQAVFARSVGEHRDVAGPREPRSCPATQWTRLNPSLLVKVPQAASARSLGGELVAERVRIASDSSLGTFQNTHRRCWPHLSLKRSSCRLVSVDTMGRRIGERQSVR